MKRGGNISEPRAPIAELPDCNSDYDNQRHCDCEDLSAENRAADFLDRGISAAKLSAPPDGTGRLKTR
jgi:hypothetical protein